MTPRVRCFIVNRFPTKGKATILAFTLDIRGFSSKIGAMLMWPVSRSNPSAGGGDFRFRLTQRAEFRLFFSAWGVKERFPCICLA